jgi:hypothetical protein
MLLILFLYFLGSKLLVMIVADTRRSMPNSATRSSSLETKGEHDRHAGWMMTNDLAPAQPCELLLVGWFSGASR